MQTSVNTIVKNLFHRNNLQEVSEDQLQEYVKLFPYSSVGHLLLAKKKKELGVEYKQAAAIAALYVNNPLWLHYFLQDESDDDNNGVHQASTVPGTETASQSVHTEPTIAESVVDENFTPDQNNATPVENIEVVAEENVIHDEPEVKEIELNAELPPNEAVVEEATSVTSALDPVPSNEPLAEKVIVDQDPIFEPYHTIDYFASQGIKLKLEELTNDKFGRQLKSFTDWLRSMKRIGPVLAEDIPAVTPTDATIQKNAEESVENSDIETEAMAEVWIKQGKTARAIAIYQKLSLLNPSKSHYFAAKIEQLNA